MGIGSKAIEQASYSSEGVLMRGDMKPGLIVVALTALLISVILMCGCTTSGRPYSPSERIAFGNALVGQSLDVVTTSMALEDPRVLEGNPVFWSDDDIEAVLTGKILFMGVGYLIGEIYPQYRKTIWWTLAGSGYVGAIWNTGSMIEHGTNPWEND